MRVLLQIAGALVLVYAGYLLLLYVGQRSMMFPGAGMAARQYAPRLSRGTEAISIPATFGTISAIFLRAPGAESAPALLYFHGNAEFAAQNVTLLQPLTALPLHVLIVEYPGYAGSDGITGRDTLGEAALLAYDWLAQHPEVDRSRIVAMGRSIGAGPAVELAVARPVAALVLLSAFSSIDAFAHGMGAPAFLIRDRYDNHSVLRAYSRPLLLFHGRRDRIIPYAHSQALAQAAPDAHMVTLECGHNDCPYFDPAFVGALEAFLRGAAVLPPD